MSLLSRQPVGLAVMATAGSLILFISLGIRSVTGLFIVPVSTDLGWGRETLSLGIAMLNLVWGITNPFICAWADKKGSSPVIFLGGLLYATGLALLALAGRLFIGPGVVITGLGVFMGTATAATGLSIVLGLLGKTFYSIRGADDRQRLIVFGVVSAVSQMGQFVLSPVLQAVIKGNGWRTAVWLPKSWRRRLQNSKTSLVSNTSKSTENPITTETEPQSLREAIFEALTSKPFIMISFAFSVCGLIGATSTLGTGLAGYLPRFFRLKLKNVLMLVYFYRGVMITTFLLVLTYGVDKTNGNEAIKTGIVLGFSFLIGFAWLTTVPLTTALLSNIYGTQYLGTLSAITFLGHQIGSFMGSYLGGLEYDRTKSMTVCWWMSVALAVFAGCMHFIADDSPPSRKSRPIVGAGVVPTVDEKRRTRGPRLFARKN
ncbi:major facilitator superfamily domain-containing protein [Chytridium lagenaria]|nr:major facilitator superfamily domain-containing protein [Chytridium lagenaria]